MGLPARARAFRHSSRCISWRELNYYSREKNRSPMHSVASASLFRRSRVRPKVQIVRISDQRVRSSAADPSRPAPMIFPTGR